MKQIILFTFLILSAACAYSQTGTTDNIQQSPELSLSNHNQQPVSSLLMNDAYKNTAEWSKYKTLRAIGWTTFGVGVATTGVGVVVSLALASIHGPNRDKTVAGPIVLCSGLGMTAASIPILISAYHYRSKAKKIGMNMGVTQLTAPTIGHTLSYTPAMNFTITF